MTPAQAPPSSAPGPGTRGEGGGRIWRVGVVGAGNIARFHLPAWQGCPNAMAVAICDPDVGRARQRAAEFGQRLLTKN